MRKLLILCVVALLAFSCTDNDAPPPPPPLPLDPADLAFVDMAQFDLTNGLTMDGVFTITAPRGVAWSITSSSSWLTLPFGDRITGVGAGAAQRIVFSVTQNNKDTPRIATLTLSAVINDSQCNVVQTVEQNYRAIALHSNPTTAGRQSIDVGAVRSNRLWYLGVSSGAEWLKLSESETYSAANGMRFPAGSDKQSGPLVSGKLYYQFDANNSSTARITTVAFMPDDDMPTFNIIAQAAPVLTLDKTSQSVEATATSATFQVESRDKQLGVTYTPTKGTNATSVSPSDLQTIDINGVYSKTITVNFAVTEDDDFDRDIVVTIAYGGDKTLTHTIIQAALPPPPIAGGVWVAATKLHWATGNLVADGASGCKIGAPTAGGLYFQWGELVGWQGGENGDGSGAANESLGVTIAVNPTGYAGLTTWDSGDDNTGSYDTDTPATGDGDPCRYYLGGRWRTPTRADYVALFGAYSGGWNDGWSWSSASAYHSSSGLRFLVSGFRSYSDGSLGSVGTYGYCWSSTVKSSRFGYGSYFCSSFINSEFSNYRSFGFPVRCVTPKE